MSQYLPAFSTLIILVLSLLGINSISHSDFKEKTNNLVQANASLLQNNQDIQRRRQTLRAAETISANTQKFLEAWTIATTDIADPADLQDDLSKRARSKDLVVRREPIAPGMEGKLPIRDIPISIKGDYPVAMAWLAEVEQRYPLSHLQDISMAPFGKGGVSIDLKLRFTDFGQTPPNPPGS
jgi:hypothetical protein